MSLQQLVDLLLPVALEAHPRPLRLELVVLLPEQELLAVQQMRPEHPMLLLQLVLPPAEHPMHRYPELEEPLLEPVLQPEPPVRRPMRLHQELELAQPQLEWKVLVEQPELPEPHPIRPQRVRNLDLEAPDPLPAHSLLEHRDCLKKSGQ